jgi:hypothetical protein
MLTDNNPDLLAVDGIPDNSLGFEQYSDIKSVKGIESST